MRLGRPHFKGRLRHGAEIRRAPAEPIVIHVGEAFLSRDVAEAVRLELVKRQRRNGGAFGA